ncbi:hypothetical protein CGLO_14779 [Colletotrichum gloeosporioides Cg-14]|uniref:Uncharacterized protein n=1 Tax=Colletotrichum gloeosporioides (strain Cg-14) TaxID=1237896 RepID=T0JSU6_COLGC|nr:hypothetical protein CGLO_14779 [Colletotrichum gloeosporioides Cg-14]
MNNVLTNDSVINDALATRDKLS